MSRVTMRYHGAGLGIVKLLRCKSDFRYFDDKNNYDCWDTIRNITSLLLVL